MVAEKSERQGSTQVNAQANVCAKTLAWKTLEGDFPEILHPA